MFRREVLLPWHWCILFGFCQSKRPEWWASSGHLWWGQWQHQDWPHWSLRLFDSLKLLLELLRGFIHQHLPQVLLAVCLSNERDTPRGNTCGGMRTTVGGRLNPQCTISFSMPITYRFIFWGGRSEKADGLTASPMLNVSYSGISWWNIFKPSGHNESFTK